MPSPLHLVLELLRADDADDPYAFRWSTNEYIRRLQDGTTRTAELAWRSDIREDLARASGTLTETGPSPRALRVFQRTAANALARLGGDERDAEAERAVRTAFERLQRDTGQTADAPSRPDPVAAARVASTLRRFLGQLGWDRDERALLDAVSEGRRIVLTLRFRAAELYALPWETVTVGESSRSLAALPGMDLRYEWPGTHTAAAPLGTVPEGGRVLLAWSAAGGRVPAAHHQAALREASERGGLAVLDPQDVLANTSLSALAGALKRATEQGRPYRLLHLLCHGGAVHGSTTTVGLTLDADQPGDPARIVDARDLHALFSRYADTLRTVVLMACRGSDPGALGNHLGSIAQQLHRAGIASVLASRHPISGTGSVVATTALYESLLVPAAPLSLEGAVRVARDALLHSDTPGDASSLQLYSRAEDGLQSRPFAFRPYRGLLSFGPADARFFLGREPETRTVLDRIEDAANNVAPGLQFVLGASGSGKSSLVFAGVLPRLRALTDRPWQITVTRPADPVPELGEGRQLLIIDQFEELFTHDTEPGKHLQAWWKLATRPDVVVLATMRVDFLGRCGGIVVEGANLSLDKIVYDSAHTVFVPQLDPGQLEVIVRTPAERVGLTWEPGLVERILTDIGEDRAALPLLQHLLDQLWERREGHKLTQEAYEVLGGFRGALTRTADEVIDQLSESTRLQARRLLVRMVRPAEDGGGRTRRRLPLAEVRPDDAHASASLDEALDALTVARLVVARDIREDRTADGYLVEIAHEALARRWQRLQDWVDEDRELLRQLDRVSRAAAEWSTDMSEDRLLRGSALAAVQPLLEDRRAELPRSTLPFLEASRRAEEERELLTEVRSLTARALTAAGHGYTRQAIRRVRQAVRLSPTDGLARSTMLQLLLGQAHPHVLLADALDAPYALCWSPRGDRLLGLREHGSLLWDAQGRKIGELATSSGVMWSPAGDRLLGAETDDLLVLYDHDGKRLRELGRLHREPEHIFRPDGARLALPIVASPLVLFDRDGRRIPIPSLADYDLAVLHGWTARGEALVWAEAALADDHKISAALVIDEEGQVVRQRVWRDETHVLRRLEHMNARVVLLCSLDLELWSYDEQRGPISLGPEPSSSTLAWPRNDNGLMFLYDHEGAATLMKTDGEAVPLRSPVGGVAAAEWSHSGELLALVVVHEDCLSLQVVDCQGQDRQTEPLRFADWPDDEPEDATFALRWSPDETLVWVDILLELGGHSLGQVSRVLTVLDVAGRTLLQLDQVPAEGEVDWVMTERGPALSLLAPGGPELDEEFAEGIWSLHPLHEDGAEIRLAFPFEHWRERREELEGFDIRPHNPTATSVAVLQPDGRAQLWRPETATPHTMEVEGAAVLALNLQPGGKHAVCKTAHSTALVRLDPHEPVVLEFLSSDATLWSPCGRALLNRSNRGCTVLSPEGDPLGVDLHRNALACWDRSAEEPTLFVLRDAALSRVRPGEPDEHLMDCDDWSVSELFSTARGDLIARGSGTWWTRTAAGVLRQQLVEESSQGTAVHPSRPQLARIMKRLVEVRELRPSGEWEVVQDFASPRDVAHVSWTPQGELMIVTPTEVLQVDLETGTRSSYQGPNRAMSTAITSPDGRWVLAAGEGPICVWSDAERSLAAVFPIHDHFDELELCLAGGRPHLLAKARQQHVVMLPLHPLDLLMLSMQLVPE